MSPNTYTTDQYDPGRFRPHGRVEYEEQGRILWSRATGPFNPELMQALSELVIATFPAMTAKGPWVNICTFNHSALCSPDVLLSFTATMKQLVQMKIAPVATAFVLTPEVDGAELMAPLFEKCFKEGGIPFACFPSIELAQQWASSRLSPPQA
ncbi:hypothetical protein RQP53_16735 [Paucibacter sp. APW11]|uniref:STAS/SEC14 domain-containing protein n=1 Tax=Roseateles aquae TaxID=3077235 RepID=A0ABU3PEA8_9BURK|nr:hypothetical protein [Paucibacter sp. APW11]MDT9000925.1 hypothetical protein [Paucibacter sp. APW11]